MFELIHRHKRIAAIIIAVASVSFIFWLFTVQDIKQMFGLKRCVVVVEGSCVTIREFRYNLILAGSSFLNDRENRRAVIDQVLNRIIQREVIIGKAKNAGVIGSTLEVMDLITSDPSFQSEGKFSPEKYVQFVERTGLSPEEYEELIKKDVTLRKFLNFIGKINYFSDYEEEFIDKITGTKLKGKAYIIRKNDIIKKVKIDEEEMKKFYRENKDLFKTEEKYEILSWTIKEKEKALDLYNRLKKGESQDFKDFQRMIKTKTEIARDKILSKLSMENRVHIIKENNVYRIYYLNSIEEPRIKKFEEVRDEIKNILRENKGEEIYQKEIIRLKNELESDRDIPFKAIEFENSGIDEFVDEFVKLFNLNNKDVIDLLFSDKKVFGPFKRGRDDVLIKIISKKYTKGNNDSESVFLKQLFVRSKMESLLFLYFDRILRDSDIDVNREYLDKLQ